MIKRQFLKITDWSITVDLWFLVIFLVYKPFEYNYFPTGQTLAFPKGIAVFKNDWYNSPNVATPDKIWFKTKLSDVIYNHEQYILANPHEGTVDV